MRWWPWRWRAIRRGWCGLRLLHTVQYRAATTHHSTGRELQGLALGLAVGHLMQHREIEIEGEVGRGHSAATVHSVYIYNTAQRGNETVGREIGIERRAQRDRDHSTAPRQREAAGGHRELPVWGTV